MNQSYKDIISRIPEEPKWWDHNGTPRYDEFHPDLSPDIYTDECVLILIRCQNCHHKFEVEMSRSPYALYSPEVGRNSFATNIPHIYYGDPPNIGCCPSGPTMSSDSLRILQYWKREKFDWVRKPEFEVELESEDQMDDP